MVQFFAGSQTYSQLMMMVSMWLTAFIWVYLVWLVQNTYTFSNILDKEKKWSQFYLKVFSHSFIARVQMCSFSFHIKKNSNEVNQMKYEDLWKMEPCVNATSACINLLCLPHPRNQLKMNILVNITTRGHTVAQWLAL